MARVGPLRRGVSEARVVKTGSDEYQGGRMTYTLEVSIARPRANVFELFENPNHWLKWQDSLVRWEALEGTPGHSGARAKLTHQFGRREIEMVETVESKHLPEEMTCIYTAPGAWNRVTHRFVEMGSHETRWIFDTEFRCTGVLRLMAFLRPGMFRNASLKDMTSFKTFAESQE